MGKIDLYIKDGTVTIQPQEDATSRDLAYTMSTVVAVLLGEDPVKFHNDMCDKSGLPDEYRVIEERK